ncbi:MAG: hypothetical protein GWP09_02580, partial [Nitrospiraceae bacterium]|nr:hypothetical protein [Nitrospiraceae bacterium]
MEEIKIKSRVNYVLVSLISLAFAVVLAPIIKLFVYVTELILAIAYHPNAHV